MRAAAPRRKERERSRKGHGSYEGLVWRDVKQIVLFIVTLVLRRWIAVPQPPLVRHVVLLLSLIHI